jgi:hypothetical protein
MGDYSFALGIRFVPTLYLSTSPVEYYDWDHGLQSHMKIFFAKSIFSKQVLQWWINLQQQQIARGEDSCRTWKGLKVILQC